MTAKVKWALAAVLWIGSIMLMVVTGLQYGYMVWFGSYILIIATSLLMCYGVYHYKLVQRLIAWMVRDGK